MKTLNIESVVCKHLYFLSCIFSAIFLLSCFCNQYANSLDLVGGVKSTLPFKNKLVISRRVGFHVLFVSRGDFSFNFH